MTGSGLGRPRNAPRVTIDSPEQLAEVVQTHRPLFDQARDRACRDFQLDLADAEDALQDALVTALRRFDAVREDVVLYLLWRFRRNCRRLSQHEPLTVTAGDLSAMESAGDPTEVVSTRAHLHKTYAELSAVDRALLAYDVLGYEGPEIARLLGKSHAAARKGLSRARERARRLWENGGGLHAPALAFALGAGRGWASRARRRLTALLNERLPTRWALQELGGWPGAIVLGVAAVTVVASAMPGGAPVRVPTGRAVAHEAVSPVHFPYHEEHGTPDTPTTSPVPPPSSDSSQSVGVVGGVLTLAGRRTGSSENPGDTQLTAAAPAPDYETSRKIVAVGFGRTCQCTVLYQTPDGGRTWTAGGAVPGAEQIVLPPDPTDPRIFLGTAAGSGFAPYVVKGIEALPLPLPLPPGHLTLSARFDDGDDRAFVSSSSALWGVDLRSMQIATVLAYPGAAGVAQVTAAVGERGSAVFVAVPHAPAASYTGASPTGLYACPISTGPCQLRSAGQPTNMTALTSTIAAGRTTLIAVAEGQVWVSTDAGRSFALAAAPPTNTVVGTISVSGSAVWATLPQINSTLHRVAELDINATTWRDVTHSNAALSHPSVGLVALTANVVLNMLNDGPLCTSDAGASWSDQCGG